MAEGPPFIVHVSDVPEEEGRYRAPFDAEALSFTRDLGKAGGSVNLGLRQERIPPGRRTSFTHAHRTEEELVYVLEGECSVRLVEPGQAPREVPLRPGHAVCFPAGTGIAHCLVNRGTKDAVVLGFGERRDADDQVFYPEDAAYNDDLREHRPKRFWDFQASKP
jgi:uncharacterized cupin superfamily protein